MGFTNQQVGGPHLVDIFFGDIPWFDAQVQHAEDAENLRQGPLGDVAGKSQSRVLSDFMTSIGLMITLW